MQSLKPRQATLRLATCAGLDSGLQLPGPEPRQAALRFNEQPFVLVAIRLLPRRRTRLPLFSRLTLHRVTLCLKGKECACPPCDAHFAQASRLANADPVSDPSHRDEHEARRASPSPSRRVKSLAYCSRVKFFVDYFAFSRLKLTEGVARI